VYDVCNFSGNKQNSKRPTLDTVLDVGLSEENPKTNNKKRKQNPEPSGASVNEEQFLPYHQLNATINQVAKVE
jgi:hypothetical protein